MIPNREGVPFPPILGPRMQVSMVVKDIESAAQFWSDKLGVGPWILIEDALEGRRFVHRGQDSPVDMSVALTYAGETQFELIAQHNDAPSPYWEFLQSGHEGVQHLEFWPDDYERSRLAFEAAGFVEISSIHLPDGTRNVSYFESPDFVGVVVAVVPMTPYRQSYFGVIEKIAATWDGSRPLRKFGTRADFLASNDYAQASA